MAHAFWRHPLFALVAAFVILGLGMGLRQSFGLFVRPITIDTGVSVATLSLAFAIQNLLWGVMTPFVGALADRYGTQRFLILGSLLYASGLAVMSVADNAFLVYLGNSVLTGLGVATVGFTLVLSAVARIAPEDKRSTWLGIASAGGSMGQFLLVPGAQLIMNDIGWSGAFLVLAAMALLIIPLSFSFASRPTKTTENLPQETMAGTLKEARRHSGYLLLTAGFFVCGFHVSFITVHLPGYVVSCNLSAQTGANALGIIGFFNVIGTLLAGWLGQRYRMKYLLAGIYFARAASIAIFLAAPKTDLVVFLFAASFGLLWLSTVPLTNGIIGRIFGPRYLATLFGITMFSHQVGAFFGAYIGGQSLALTGDYDLVWWISIGLAVLAGLLNMPISDAPRRQPQVQPAE